MAARGYVNKTDLTPIEKIVAAYMYHWRGVDQHIIADFFRVNHGRVNEGIMEVRRAVGLAKAGDKLPEIFEPTLEQITSTPQLALEDGQPDDAPKTNGS